MQDEVVRIAPGRLRFKIDHIHDLTEPVQGGDWDIARRMPLDATHKHRAIVQRFVSGIRWEDTELFRDIYARRLAAGEILRGCSTIEALAAKYYAEVDAMYLHMRDHGFLARIDGVLVPLPEVFIGRDGEVILSNQGNHRVAMAKVLQLPWILATVRTRHAELERMPDLEVVEIPPVLPACARDIPAMSSSAEQLACYELALAHGAAGEVVELGTWLGACTANLAAGLRDVGARRKVHAYDRFVWQEIHEYKAGGPLANSNMLEQFKANMGPLMHFVEPHAGEILQQTWAGGPIALLICDAPKRTREIAKTMNDWGTHLMHGSVMAWQDFFYFPAYDLPVAFQRMEELGILEFAGAVYPGTMAKFKLLRRPRGGELTDQTLGTKGWDAQRIHNVWPKWRDRLPPAGRARFMVGACMFLHDVGAVADARRLMHELLEENAQPIVEKFKYFAEKRQRMVHKYPALFEVLAQWNR
jgi:hypothetical protein